MKKLTVKLENKETIAYTTHGSKNHPALLLVHGNMSSGVHYEPMIDDLKQAYYLIIPDLRGFGDSTYITPIECLEDFADDLKRLLDVLDVSKVSLVGWSTGGGIGLKFAAKYPKSIEKLVLLESASYKGYPIYKKDASYQPILTELYQSKEDMALDPVQVLPAEHAMQNKDINFMKQVWLAAIYNVHVPEEEALERFLSETLKQRNLIDVDWALVTFNMSHESNGVVEGDGSIDDVVCPVLSIYGEKDYVILRSMFDETVQALKNVETEVYSDGSHSPITDFPKRLTKRLLMFLKS